MPQVEASLISYLVPGTGSFWRWSADGEAIVWTDGSTIVLRDELLEILSRLAFNGLPPFGSLVLLLAACRNNWTDFRFQASRDFYTRCLEQSYRSNAGRIVAHRIGHGLKNVFDRLNDVSALRAELRESTAAKAVLAEVAFENAEKQLTPLEATGLCAAFREGLNIEALVKFDSPDVSDKEAAAELDALEAGLTRLDPEQLALRRRTGLDRVVEPADLKVPLAERVHRLVFQLREDAELSGLARLTQSLMAAVSVPRRLASPEDLALGGISDLTNRGPIDRLLVSELAHDDLTLAVRIALNEALYIRREAPARDPRQRRVILVDSGIRTWGVSRVFATAVALALSATTIRNAELSVFRADGAEVIAVDFATRSGLIEHLEALTPHPHPGAALPPLAEQLAQEDLSTDLIIITHEDALDDADFGRYLCDELAACCYVGTVNRDGGFRLWQTSARGRKLICQAELSLDDLFTKASDKPATWALVTRRGDRELPVILSMEPFPLRLPEVLDPRHARASEQSGLIGVSSDGRLLQWTSGVCGARQLTDTVPTGRLLEIVLDDDQNIAHVCTVDPRKNRMTIVHAALDTKRCTRDEFACNNPLKVYFDRGTFLLIYRKEVRAITPGGVRRCLPLKLSPLTRWHSGRCFTDGHSIFAVSFDGSDLHLERIGEDIRIAWFDRAGRDGIWSLSADGSVFDGTGERVTPAKSASLGPVKLVGVSPDGSRIAVETNRNKRTAFVLDLNDALTWREVQGYVHRGLVGPQLDWSLSSGVNIRHNFSGIAVGQSGNLTLISNWSHAFMLNEDGQLILADLGHVADSGRQKVAFQHATPPPGCRYDLKCATWKDGSRAYLDSRGMLHLKSSDAGMPELTLILSNRGVSGWTSVGATFGWSYFVGDAPTTTGHHVYELIRQFVSRLR